MRNVGLAGATRRDVLAAAAAIAASGGTAAAQTPAREWSDVVKLARTEGQVNLYTSVVPQQVERLIVAFRKKFPEIRVSHTRGVGELPPRVEAERTTGTDGADVFIYADPLWFNRNAEHFVPLQTPAAAAFPDERGWQVKGLAANVGFWPFGVLVWNTDYVKDGLKDHRDLLKPELRGRIGVRDEVTAVVAGYLDFLEKSLGEDYLRALGQQKPKFYGTIVPAVQAVASGEVWAANVGAPFLVHDLQEQGAPLGWRNPDPKGFANPQVAAVLKNSKRPNAALAFMDYMLSPEGQIVLNAEASGSPIVGLAGPLDVTRYELLKAEDFPPDVIVKWRKKFAEYFRP